MGHRKRRCKWILLVILCLQAANAAALEPLQWTGRYQFAWNGIALGSLVLAIDDTPAHYAMHLLVHSQGIINLFTHHESDTTVQGLKGNSGYRPLDYESHYSTKKKPRYIHLVYDASGKITEETVEPAEDRAIRPEVPHALKDGAFDPLTALMQLRAGKPGFRAFDARRLYAVKATASDNAVLQIAGKARDATSYSLSRTPLAGLTVKETAAYRQGEPPLKLFFSADAQRIPLGMQMPLYFGSVTGTLVKECGTWQECL